MSKTYRAGLVGCGGMGRHHLQVLNELPEFELVALCDIFPDAVNASGDEYGVEARYLDFDQMYDEAKLDLVTVATQTRGHHAVPRQLRHYRHAESPSCARNLSPLISSKRMTWSPLRKGPARSSPFNQQNHVNPGIRKAQAMVKEGSHRRCYLGTREKQSWAQEW